MSLGEAKKPLGQCPVSLANGLPWSRWSVSAWESNRFFRKGKEKDEKGGGKPKNLVAMAEAFQGLIRATS